MRTFGQRIRPYLTAEIEAAERAEAAGRHAEGFRHLERAHVLGQPSTVEHVRVHVRMLRWAIRHHDAREMLGQAMRIVGAATKTAFGWVPTGNTGGANVSPFKPMPVPADLQATIDQVRQGARGP